MVLHLKNWVSPNATILAVERAIGLRILPCQSGNANDECSASSLRDQRNDFCPFMLLFTMPSMFNAISPFERHFANSSAKQ
jgi:hypothetical protein